MTSPGRADIDRSSFRQLLGRFATGVTVVTALDAQGRPHGMTANSLASVSLEPPLLLVSVDHAASLHPIITAAAVFTVNILERHQETLSRRFAGAHEDRFDGIGYTIDDGGFVRLSGVLASIACERWATHRAGDHTIVIGRVVHGEATDGRPLCYYRGGYAELD